MSRFFFHILTDPGDGDLEFDTSIAVGDLAVDLDGSPSGLSFVQVGDGYYFDYTVSGLYTISILAVDQDEYTNIPLVADEDNVNTQMAQSVDGYIYMSGGFMRVYTDGSSKSLHAGDIIDNDTAGGAAVPASAAIVKTLGSEIDTLSNAIGGIGGSARWRHVYSEHRESTIVVGNAVAAPTEWEETAAAVKKIGFEVDLFDTDDKIRIRCELKVAAGGDAISILYIDDDNVAQSQTITSTSWTSVLYELTFASSVVAGIYKIEIALGGDAVNKSYMRKVAVQVRGI